MVQISFDCGFYNAIDIALLAVKIKVFLLTDFK